MNTDPFSRPIACAHALGAHAADAGRFHDKRVLLTGERETLETENGRLALRDCVRLLMRICRHVHVHVPLELIDLRAEVQRLGDSIAFGYPLMPEATLERLERFDSVLNIGVEVIGSNMTTINSDGWVARVSSRGRLRGDCSRTNAIGALAAASLGVSETFKRLARVRQARGPLFDQLEFSTYSWSTQPPVEPDLPASIRIPRTLVCGQGAIGNGLVLILGQLPVEGEILLLDRQAYGPENLGTCVLIGPNDVGDPKAEVNARWMKALGKSNVIPLKGTIESLLGRFGQDLDYPSVIVNGLDNVEARHAIQDLWPDRIIDGAIGDFSCQVASHVAGSETACMKCLFSLPAGPDPQVVASKETGLTLKRAGEVDSLISESDVIEAPPEKRDLLKRNIGRQICSVISEAVLSKVSADDQRFSPSVPFVATMSAALCAAALVRHAMGDSPDSRGRFQFDLLVGPGNGELFNEHAKPSCICRERRDLIAAVRRDRAERSARRFA